MRAAETTFDSKSAAERWLTLKEAEILHGEWVDPDAGKVLFQEYAAAWVEERDLSERTDELYRGLLRNHILPAFGESAIADIKERQVRRWRKERLTSGPESNPGFGPVTVAKAYRLLHAILSTATDDGDIKRNPCRIKGAGQEESEERPVLSLQQVLVILDAVQPRYRALLLLATFASLRWGELIALRKTDIDLEAGTVRVDESVAQLDNGQFVGKPPKSKAGIRTVSFPRDLSPELRWHIERFAEPEPDGRLFVGPKGAIPRRQNFNQRTWSKARKAVGMPNLHLHDLRHTGGTLAAGTGASLKELMGRLGHSSPRAALIYQHRTQERDEAIAVALGQAFKIAQAGEAGKSATTNKTKIGKPSGTNLARKRKPAS
jgi:integrase